MSDKKRWREATLNPSLNKNENSHNEIDSDFVNSEEDLKDNNLFLQREEKRKIL